MVMKKQQQQKAKYLWSTRCNAKEVRNANRDQPAYQKPIVRNKAVVFGGG